MNCRQNSHGAFDPWRRLEIGVFQWQYTCELRELKGVRKFAWLAVQFWATIIYNSAKVDQQFLPIALNHFMLNYR